MKSTLPLKCKHQLNVGEFAQVDARYKFYEIKYLNGIALLISYNTNFNCARPVSQQMKRLTSHSCMHKFYNVIHWMYRRWGMIT